LMPQNRRMPDADFKILFVADVVGHPGRDAVKAILPALKKELRPNLTIVNGENAAGGFGLSAKIAAEPQASGPDSIQSGNRVLAPHPGSRIVFCDMHAEATSEKNAMGWYLDGRASAVVGTHTHVPTADARILPGGTAYVTDVGMVGPRDGCIGMDKDIVVQRFLTGVPSRFAVASGPVTFNSVLVNIDGSTGRATSIQRVDRDA